MTLSPILGWSRGIRRAWIVWQLESLEREFVSLEREMTKVWQRGDLDAMREVAADLEYTRRAVAKLEARL